MGLVHSEAQVIVCVCCVGLVQLYLIIIIINANHLRTTT